MGARCDVILAASRARDRARWTKPGLPPLAALRVGWLDTTLRRTPTSHPLTVKQADRDVQDDRQNDTGNNGGEDWKVNANAVSFERDVSGESRKADSGQEQDCRASQCHSNATNNQHSRNRVCLHISSLSPDR